MTNFVKHLVNKINWNLNWKVSKIGEHGIEIGRVRWGLRLAYAKKAVSYKNEVQLSIHKERKTTDKKKKKHTVAVAV